MAAGQLEPRAAPAEREPIAKVDRMEDRFQFMKAIGALAQAVQEQVDLAGRFFFQRRHRLSCLAALARK
jgi:hypothetical protein